jgi:plasmid stabilization system protein ParE
VGASYLLTLHAQNDIDLEADAIENEDAAARWVDDLHDALDRLGRTPGLGHTRMDITGHDVLFWTFRKRWAVIYRVVSRASSSPYPIAILRVISWSRVMPGFWLGASW